MIKRKLNTHQAALAIGLTGLMTSNAAGVSSSPVENASRLHIPSSFDVDLQDGLPIMHDASGKVFGTTLNSEIQQRMQAFIAERGSPIASVVVIDIRTGDVLTMAQGKSPEKWGSTTHTALYSRFPAASLFKTVVTTAALEMTPTSPDQSFGLPGGCGGQDITPSATWLNDKGGGFMNLRRAFGHSCNGFFAKLAVNQLGIGAITRYAKLFGWESDLPLDISVEPSRMLPPPAATSTTHTIGRFAAGFGHVGISPIHAAWMATVIANQGVVKPLNLIRSSEHSPAQIDATPIYSKETASRLMDVLQSTVHGGTASHAFNRGKYRALAGDVGGKTGTLQGRTPAGLTSLFFGVYPLSSPRIAVSAVVVLEDRFYFKAPQLAAEAILSWKEFNARQVQARR